MGFDATKGTDGEVGIVGSYTTAGDIEIRGTPAGLADLARLLVSETGKSVMPLLIPERSQPAPYEAFLTSILVERVGDLIQLDLNDSELVITGSTENVQTLADNIIQLAESVEGEVTERHIHIDYHRGHYYLAPSSASLVVTCTNTQS